MPRPMAQCPILYLPAGHEGRTVGRVVRGPHPTPELGGQPEALSGHGSAFQGGLRHFEGHPAAGAGWRLPQPLGFCLCGLGDLSWELKESGEKSP